MNNATHTHETPPRDVFLAKCSRCKTRARFVAPITRQIETKSYYGTERTVWRAAPWGEEQMWNGRISVRCLCGGHALFEHLHGHHSDKKKCGARCMNAVGPSCECQCAGKNHGANHG